MPTSLWPRFRGPWNLMWFLLTLWLESVELFWHVGLPCNCKGLGLRSCHIHMAVFSQCICDRFVIGIIRRVTLIIFFIYFFLTMSLASPRILLKTDINKRSTACSWLYFPAPWRATGILCKNNLVPCWIFHLESSRCFQEIMKNKSLHATSQRFTHLQIPLLISQEHLARAVAVTGTANLNRS